MSTTTAHKFQVGDRVQVPTLLIGEDDDLKPVAGTILRLIEPTGVFATAKNDPCYVVQVDDVGRLIGFPESALENEPIPEMLLVRHTDA